MLVLAAYHNREELLGQYEFLSRKLENYHFELRDLPSGSCFELNWLGVPGEIWNKMMCENLLSVVLFFVKNIIYCGALYTIFR